MNQISRKMMPVSLMLLVVVIQLVAASESSSQSSSISTQPSPTTAAPTTAISSSCNRTDPTMDCVSVAFLVRMTGAYWKALLLTPDFPSAVQSTLEESLDTDILVLLNRYSSSVGTVVGSPTEGGGNSSSSTSAVVDLVSAYALTVRVTHLGAGPLEVGFSVDSGKDATGLSTSVVSAIQTDIRNLVLHSLASIRSGGEMTNTAATYASAIGTWVSSATVVDPVLLVSISIADYNTAAFVSEDANCGSFQCKLSILVMVLIVFGVVAIILLLVLPPCCRPEKDEEDDDKVQLARGSPHDASDPSGVL